MSSDLKERFLRDGYVIVEVFSVEALKRLQNDCAALYEKTVAREQPANPRSSIRWSLFNEKHGIAHLQRLTYAPELLTPLEGLFGPDLIFEGGSMMAGAEGTAYKQGWHRDVLQIPEDQIDERMFSANWFHNCLQVNLSVYDDATLWAVPGSHRRPNRPAETAAFGGTKHQSDPDAEMPGALALEVPAGFAAIYNNNLIHRGHNATAARRMVYHASYHSPRHRPTWHFYGHRFWELLPETVAALAPELQAMHAANVEVHEKYPDIEETYRAGDNFVPELSDS